MPSNDEPAALGAAPRADADSRMLADRPEPAESQPITDKFPQPPWYGNIAIAAGLLAVPGLMGLALLSPAVPGPDIAGQSPKLSRPALHSAPASGKPTVDSVEQARLRLTPI